MMGLSEAAGKMPRELSGGMQQRASIARALVHDPDVIFMDEPFGALDALTRDAMAAHLQEVHMQQGKTVLFVTHSIGEAALLSDRVLVMSKGPGQVVHEVRIDTPRPRVASEMHSSAATEIELALRSQGLVSSTTEGSN